MSVKGKKSAKQEPTKEFLFAFGLSDFYETRTKSFNRGNMVWKDTHVSRLGRNVHFNYILRIEDSLQFDKFLSVAGEVDSSNLVGKHQRKF